MENIEIKKSGIHNKGVFAKKDIKKGTEVIEYTGRKITKRESDKIAEKQIERSKKDKSKGAVYIFELNKKYDIDGNISGNPAKFINHSCDPNAETQIEDKKKIWVVATKDIKKGEEITYNYGYDIDNFEEHLCKCGSKNCVGYILDKKQWKKLKKEYKRNS